MLSAITPKVSIAIIDGMYSTVASINREEHPVLRKICLICALPLDAAVTVAFPPIYAIECLALAAINFLGSVLGFKSCNTSDGWESLYSTKKYIILSFTHVYLTACNSLGLLSDNLSSEDEILSNFPFGKVHREFGPKPYLSAHT